MKGFVNKLIERLEKINPVDYGSIGSYEAHSAVKDCLRDVGKIVNELAEEYKEDYCEWKSNRQFNWFIESPHKGIGIIKEEHNLFKFCPCCGKKIKVVPYTEGE